MKTDKSLFVLSSICIFVGIVFSYSLTTFTVLYYEYDTSFHFFFRQFVVGFLGISFMWGISLLNPDKWLNIIGFSLFLLCLILMGFMHYLPDSLVTSAGGAKRWLRLPGISLAPVEFFKIGFVYFLAWSFSRKLSPGKKSLKEEFFLILPYFGLFLIVIYLIAVMQNDIGQVIVLALTLSVMAFFAGTSVKFFSLTILGSIVIFVLAIINSENRIMRIKVWWATVQNFVLSLFPENIAQMLRIENIPEAYQISHSLNAIKHGGLFGQGIGNGMFKLGYLSDVHTDFVLAGITEEIGAFGTLIITLVFLLIIQKLFLLSSRSENRVHSLFILGVSLLIIFSFLMNAYGITSITPIKGIAVPFLSYGGSSLLATCVSVGLVLMISKRIKQ